MLRETTKVETKRTRKERKKGEGEKANESGGEGQDEEEKQRQYGNRDRRTSNERVKQNNKTYRTTRVKS